MHTALAGACRRKLALDLLLSLPCSELPIACSSETHKKHTGACCPMDVALPPFPPKLAGQLTAVLTFTSYPKLLCNENDALFSVPSILESSPLDKF